MFMWCLSLMPILVVRVRVPDQDVGIEARRDHALAVEPEHPRRRGRARLDPPLEADLAGDDTLVDQLHPVLDAADPVRDLREVAEAELLLVLEAERAVVGRDDRQLVHPEPLPQIAAGGVRAWCAAGSSRPTWRPRSPAARAGPPASGRGTAGRSRRTR